MSEPPENPPIFQWGHPGHIEADWENREDEHLGLCVRAYDHPLQYKVDIWADANNKGVYRMRLDGFGHLRWFAAESLRELADDLRLIEVRDVISSNRQMRDAMVKAYKQWADNKEGLKGTTMEGARWPEPPLLIPEAVITEYFEAARAKTLEELDPIISL